MVAPRRIPTTQGYVVTLGPDPSVRDVIRLPNTASFSDPVDILTPGGLMAHLGTSGIPQIWSVRSIFRRLSDPPWWWKTSRVLGQLEDRHVPRNLITENLRTQPSWEAAPSLQT